MELHIATSEQHAAETAAARIADLLRAAIDDRGWATLALSGGSSPDAMYRALAGARLDWARVTVFQVDERLVASDDAARNATAIEDLLLRPTGAAAELFRSTAAAESDGVAAEIERVTAALERFGEPPVLDVVHLGLGADGHTASWPPHHPVLDELDARVAFVADFHGHDRLTLTPPVVDNAGTVVWLVAGEGKRAMLIRLMSEDPEIPAGRVTTRRQIVVSAVDRRLVDRDD